MIAKNILTVAFAWVVACGIPHAGAAHAQASGTPGTEVRPRQSFDMRVPVPPAPVTIAGAPRLVYELHLTNVSRKPLVLERVDVLDAETAGSLAALESDSLKKHLKRIDLLRGDPGLRTFAPGMRGVVYLWLTPDHDARPRALAHRLTFHVAGQAAAQPIRIQGGRTAVEARAPVALGPPLCGGPWVAVYNPRWERGHRRTFYTVENRTGTAARIPGRFAIDWIKVDADGRLARGDKDEVTHWYGYGARVLAVADAVVAATRENLPESATLSGAHPETDAGNYIALDLGQGRYAFYEHLKPGSIRVEPGDHVQRGQVIAALGFTGHSTGPHLHFHVADAPSPEGAEGMPFVLEDFRMPGSYKDFSAFGTASWTPRNAATKASRRGELPAPFAVVDFGACTAATR